jgi:hypothetical protein
MVTVRRAIIFLNISRHPSLFTHSSSVKKSESGGNGDGGCGDPPRNLNEVFWGGF